MEGGNLGILNVYASNLDGERCAMWIEVLQLLPLDCRWIMSRDFIIVESPLDKVIVELDRFYSFSNSVHNHDFYVVHYKILGDSSFVDNHPHSFLINLSSNLQGGSSWRANPRFLQEAKDPIKA